jgi:hypothetical protein
VSRLRAVYFMPGVHVVSGVTGYPSSLSHWAADKYEKLKCTEQKNGDVHLTSDDGVVREISALVIAYRVRVPDEVKPQTTAVRREAVTT